MHDWNRWQSARPRALVGVSVALALTACGGNAREGRRVFVSGDTSELFGSGERLKAHYLDGGGGARELLSFWDSALGIDCVFVAITNDEYRCLPIASTSSFSDSACTEPVLFADGICATDPAPVAGSLVTAGTPACDARVGAYKLVEPRDLGATFSRNPGGYCLGSGAGPSTPRNGWSLEPEPLTHFVAGRESFVGAANGAQARRVTGEDGSFVNLGLVTDGVSCTPLAAGDLIGCVPGPITVRGQLGTVFTDETCSDSTVARALLDNNQRCSGELPQYVIDHEYEVCEYDTFLYAAGAVIDDVFEHYDTCQPLAARNPDAATVFSYVRIGARAPLSGFPRVTEGRVGSGALTVGYWGDSTGALLIEQPQEPVGLINWNLHANWTHQGGAPCNLVPDADRRIRCVHDAAVMADRFYSDASCTASIQFQNAHCTSPVKYLIDGHFSLCKSEFSQAYLANAYSGPVYSRQFGSCASITDDQSYYRFFTVGAPVPIETFPPVAETTDP